MRFEVVAFLKFGFFASALLLSTDLLYSWYLRQKNRTPRLNEVNFVMSNALPCCPHTADVEVIKKCRNPHCKAKLSRKIIEQIDSAKHLICIAMYMFTMRHMADAIMNAKKRGVHIRIITDFSMTNDHSQINKLQGDGIAIRIAGNGDLYMHNKYCLIDVLTGETKFKENTHPLNGVLINGSMNWTTNGFERNWENIIFTSDDHLKSEFKRSFDYIWSRCA